MRIFRDYEEIEKCKSYGGFEIPLTMEEIMDAYELQKLEYYAEDITMVLDERISDAGMDDYYAQDWSMRVGHAAAKEVRNRLADYDRYNQICMEIVTDVVYEKLKQLGIDPETMRKVGK